MCVVSYRFVAMLRPVPDSVKDGNAETEDSILDG